MVSSDSSTVSNFPRIAAQHSSRAAIPWLPLLWFSILLLVAFRAVVGPMVREWAELSEMRHAPLVPLFTGYLVWRNVGRTRPLDRPIRTAWLGMLLVVGGALVSVIGDLGANMFVGRLGFLAASFGVAWTLAGNQAASRIAVPWLALLFMIRVPLFVYSQLVTPIQLFSFRLAERALSALGIPILRDGESIAFIGQTVLFNDAFRGVALLYGFVFLALAYATLTLKPERVATAALQRTLFVAAAVATLLAMNALRIVAFGWVNESDPSQALDLFRWSQGWVVPLLALTLAIVLHQAARWAARLRHDQLRREAQ